MKDKRAGRLRGQIRPAPCGAQSGSPPRAPSAGPRPTKTAKAPHGCLRPERAEARRGRRRLEGGEQFAMEMSPRFQRKRSPFPSAAAEGRHRYRLAKAGARVRPGRPKGWHHCRLAEAAAWV